MKASLLLLSLLCVLGAGCDSDPVDKAAQAAKDAAKEATQAIDEARVAQFASDLVAAVELRDLTNLGRLCTQSGTGDYQEVMTCYYSAFAIENEQGVEAARLYLANESAAEANTPSRQAGLELLTKYFDAKGTLCTKELAGLVLILALEYKYPHGGGKVGTLVARKLGLLAEAPTGDGQASAPPAGPQ